jgi:hypothetical protein
MNLNCVGSQSGIHDLFVKLLILDIPTNYEERMGDLNAINNLEL